MAQQTDNKIDLEQGMKAAFDYFDKVSSFAKSQPVNEVKQTAVNWLIEQLEVFVTLDEELTWDKMFDKAKQMEKEQIIKAHGDRGWAKPTIDDNGIPQKDGIIFGTTTGEQYYNEIYGK